MTSWARERGGGFRIGAQRDGEGCSALPPVYSANRNSPAVRGQVGSHGGGPDRANRPAPRPSLATFPSQFRHLAAPASRPLRAWRALPLHAWCLRYVAEAPVPYMASPDRAPHASFTASPPRLLTSRSRPSRPIHLPLDHDRRSDSWRRWAPSTTRTSPSTGRSTPGRSGGGRRRAGRAGAEEQAGGEQVGQIRDPWVTSSS